MRFLRFPARTVRSSLERDVRAIVAALTTAAAHTSAITREARTLPMEAPLTAQDDYEAANDRVLLRVLWIRHGLLRECARQLLGGL